jgi:DNA-binding NarL/FixJ family response regulator
MISSGPITVAIGAFEDLLARGLRDLVTDDPSLELVATGIAPERLDETISFSRPRVALVDLATLPTPAAVRGLSQRHPDTRIVLLASRPSATESAQLVAFGATACLAKEAQERDVINAIHLASRGLHVIPRADGEHAAVRGAAPLLTARETEVLLLLREGRSNGEIAHRLQVGIETVRTHARHIYAKLGVGSRRELIGS